MHQLTFDITDLKDLPDVCLKLLAFAGNNKVFTFNGEMGAGKTTLIKQLCEVLGAKDNFSSPTYSIVNEYHYPQGKIFHFDLYRLKSQDELFDIGFEEYIDSGEYCFIEWPELGKSFLERPFVSVVMEHQRNKRYLCAKISD